MEMEKILKIIEAVSVSSLTSFSMEEGNMKISMEANKGVTFAQAPVMAESCNTVQNMIPSAKTEEAEEGNIVRSPLVGVFYNAPSEDAEPFVSVGSVVKKGQIIGIVEAMKLMNEVESEFDGIVEEILVSNEQMVEYGQPVIRLK